jgi:hemin uptake protein HemP
LESTPESRGRWEIRWEIAGKSVDTAFHLDENDSYSCATTFIAMLNSPRPQQQQTFSPKELSTPIWDSAVLFDKRHEVLIAHEGETYRLRRTRQGKLILTK